MPERQVPGAGEGALGDEPYATQSALAQRLRHCGAELAMALRENERIRHAMQVSEQKFQCLIEQSLIGISLTDGQCFTYVNPKYAEITGYSIDELMHMGPTDIVQHGERAKAAEMIRRGLNGEFDGNFAITIHVLRKDGAVVVVELTGGPPVEVDGSPELISMLVDITERVHAENEIKQLNVRLREQAIRDPLTDLFNRRYLEETLVRELIRADRQKQQVSLVMGDLDRFKLINDTHGHQFGDKVLQVFGSLIRQHSRRSDVPCRYGGEEFLLVLPDMGPQKAYERAELLRRIIDAKPVMIGNTAVTISVSFGVATYPVDARDAEGLIAAADQSLYRAKAAGRNRVCGSCDDT